MDKTSNKIGFSKIGGIFIGKNIESALHQHQSIAVVFSLNESFEIFFENGKSMQCQGAIIPREISYKLISSKSDYTVFLHIDPFSEVGITLTQNDNNIHSLNRSNFAELLHDYIDWFKGEDNTQQRVHELIEKTVKLLKERYLFFKNIDERVLKCIEYARNLSDESFTLKKAADIAELSKSRFYHLFKENTGISFRQFLLHCKLVKSLQSIHHQDDLTEATFFGGFSDQPHFHRTFKKNFGIKPSIIKK